MVVKNLKASPLIIAWGVWLGRNASLFEDKYVPTIHCAHMV
jgi:hypothetical protein